MSNLIKILDKTTREVIQDYPFKDLELASIRAKELEEWGVEVEISVPNVIETLGHSLGQLDKEKLDQEINEELSEH